jgi:hypothetical protein
MIAVAEPGRLGKGQRELSRKKGNAQVASHMSTSSTVTSHFCEALTGLFSFRLEPLVSYSCDIVIYL